MELEDTQLVAGESGNWFVELEKPSEEVTCAKSHGLGVAKPGFKARSFELWAVP